MDLSINHNHLNTTLSNSIMSGIDPSVKYEAVIIKCCTAYKWPGGIDFKDDADRSIDISSFKVPCLAIGHGLNVEEFKTKPQQISGDINYVGLLFIQQAVLKDWSDKGVLHVHEYRGQEVRKKYRDNYTALLFGQEVGTFKTDKEMTPQIGDADVGTGFDVVMDFGQTAFSICASRASSQPRPKDFIVRPVSPSCAKYVTLNPAFERA